eukprot:jgi/Botrbrau1/13001/Bobra.384_1s0025.1
MVLPDEDNRDEVEQDELKQRLTKVVTVLRDLPELQGQNGVSTLCQVWLPDISDDNEVVLRTKGETFGVYGSACDLLAELRVVACHIDYTIDNESCLVGPPGHAFATGRAIFEPNLQKYGIENPKSPKGGSGTQVPCVHSVLVLPIFDTPDKKEAVAALEIVQNAKDMAFQPIVKAITRLLEDCSLYTSSELTEADEMDGDKAALQAGDAVDARPVKKSEVKQEAEPHSSKPGTGQQSSTQTNWEEAGPDTQRRGPSAWKGGRSSARKAEPVSNGTGSGDDSGGSGKMSDGESEDKDMGDAEGNESPDKPAGKSGKGSGSQGGGRVARRGTGTCGKPGKKLQLHELQAQFGLGLKEAAARLRVCPTTLKRACRRHGIQRWPRRQVLRDSGTDAALPTSTGVANLTQPGGLSARNLPQDIALASILGANPTLDPTLMHRLSSWGAGGSLGLLGGLNGLEHFAGSRGFSDVTGSTGVRLAEALSMRQAMDGAGGDPRSGGAKPLPGPSYDQMDITGFGGDGSSPHSRGAGDDHGGSPALNNYGLNAFASAGLLDQALRGLTPPSPSQRGGDMGDIHLQRMRLQQHLQHALRKANNQHSLRQLAQANAFNRQLGGSLTDSVLAGTSNSNASLNDLLQEAEALLKQPRRGPDPMMQQALDICHNQGPLKSNADYEHPLRMMQSLTGRRPGTGGGDTLPMSPTGLGASGVDEQALLRAITLAHGGMSRGLEPAAMFDPSILSIFAGAEGNTDFSGLGGETVLDPSLIRMLTNLG